MKKWFSLLFLPSIFITCSALVAACGEDEEGTPKPPGYPIGEPVWETITDPQTNKTFRCYTAFQKYHDAGGPVIWCYEL